LLSLLNIAEENDGNTLGIITYVAATSRRKILRGLERDSHSGPFFENLLDIPPARAQQSARPFPNRQHVHPTLATRDAGFLEALSAPINEELLQLSTIGIPNLMKMAMAYKPGMAVPLIYTNATCEDVHRLLCHVLRCYDASLAVLDNVEVHPPIGVMDQFEIAVYGVATCGLVLQTLAHSSFIDEHMYRILPPDLRTQRYHDDQHHAYADWLRSLVEHVEAADKITPHIRSKHISIEIVAVPDCGISMRPWKHVVKEIMCSSSTTQSFKYTEQDAIEAIEAIELLASKNANLENRLKGDMLLGQNFRGTVHAQTCLASIIHLLYNPSESRDLVVSVFVAKSPVQSI
jgi:hypothetical protein